MGNELQGEDLVARKARYVERVPKSVIDDVLSRIQTVFD